MSTLSTGHNHSHDHDHSHDHEQPTMREMFDGQESPGRVDLKILAVLLGCTILIAAVIAHFLFETPEHADWLAMFAAVLLGAPIVYGAGRSVLTGRCSYDHGDGHHHHHHHKAGESCGSCSSGHDHGQEHGHTHGVRHMEELVALAIIASFASGAYLECAAVAFFMLIASLIEHRTAVGALKQIEALIRITPTKAVLLTAEGEKEVAAASLKPGDRVLVLPGDNIPGDGVVREGHSTVDQANITGESLPVEKAPGEEVFGGTINQTGRLEIQITRAGEDSTLGKVQGLILQAAQSRPAVVRELTKYAAYYTPVVLMLAGIIYVFTRDLRNSISLLLIACPCALILAGPTAIVAALSAAARLGLLVKSVGDLEVVRRVTAFVFDKTGTLTTGQLAVTKMRPAEGISGAELLQACVSAEQASRHPVARAVIDVAEKAKIQYAKATQFEEVPGRGVHAEVEGAQLVVGRESFLAEAGVDMSGLDMSETKGMSLLFVARDGKAIGWLGLSDRPRPDAAASLQGLEAMGVGTRVMITGDRWSAARRAAQELNLTDVQAEALPGDKLTLVEDLKAAGHTVAVIGDGVNDGPALAAGHVSIAMGAAGSDVAVHSASIALMNNRLDRLPFLVDLSHKTIAVIRQNLIGTLVYILLMLVLLALGYMSPLVAAIGHGVSSILVIFNSARLVREGEHLEEVAHGGESEEQQRRARRIERVASTPSPATGAVPA